MRIFNTTGHCRPEWHYMVEPLRGLKEEIYSLIQNKQYFLIHAPRQSGKTTLLHSLAKNINDEGNYIAVTFTVEEAGVPGISEKSANQKMLKALYDASTLVLSKEYLPPEPEAFKNKSLKDYLVEWSGSMPKKIVLLVDEIDSLIDKILISVLRQLRSGFTLRPDKFPVSVALVGLRDIRDYKQKIRKPELSLGSGSPFNIKAESFMLKNFTQQHITDLLGQYISETKQDFPDEAIYKIYDYTGGQPWLVNAMAHEITARILKHDYSLPVTPEIVDIAKENLIQRRDTHLDSLLDKLQEERVKPIVKAIINGEELIYDNFNNDLQYCLDLGIILRTQNGITFSNKIYAEIIPRTLNYDVQESIAAKMELCWFIRGDGSLDMDTLLKEYQKFYRRHSEHWINMMNYREAGHQLMLMAFLQRVINAGGRIEREMALGRGRTDLTIYYGNDIFVLELKIKYDKWVYEEGLDQISRYLDTLGINRGYLILFELKPSSEVSWEQRIKWEEVAQNEKTIIVVEM
ncbi:MAG: ATP-binding protein [Bacteroidia bacterium]|nr:ATP-binding protein [Bacteroidia bacterium]